MRMIAILSALDRNIDDGDNDDDDDDDDTVLQQPWKVSNIEGD